MVHTVSILNKTLTEVLQRDSAVLAVPSCAECESFTLYQLPEGTRYLQSKFVN